MSPSYCRLGRCICKAWLFALLAYVSALGDPVSFLGLGDLPGGTTASVAHGVSADGSVVVGISNSSNGWEAFLWTPQTAMLGLGDLPPNPPFESRAEAVSADG